jgi:hypothetical protein
MHFARLTPQAAQVQNNCVGLVVLKEAKNDKPAGLPRFRITPPPFILRSALDCHAFSGMHPLALGQIDAEPGKFALRQHAVGT